MFKDEDDLISQIDEYSMEEQAVPKETVLKRSPRKYPTEQFNELDSSSEMSNIQSLLNKGELNNMRDLNRELR